MNKMRIDKAELENRITSNKASLRTLENNTIVHKNGFSTFKSVSGDIELIHYYLRMYNELLQSLLDNNLTVE